MSPGEQDSGPDLLGHDERRVRKHRLLCGRRSGPHVNNFSQNSDFFVKILLSKLFPQNLKKKRKKKVFHPEKLESWKNCKFKFNS